MLAVGQAKLGIEDENLVKAMGPFGGGLGANGEVCGALIGALATLGLRFSRGNEKERDDLKVWSYSQELVKRFQEDVAKGYNSFLCRDISNVNWKDMDQYKRFYKGEGGKFLECQRIVGETVELVAELLDRSLK